jgi:peptidylprolyl isomerase
MKKQILASAMILLSVFLITSCSSDQGDKEGGQVTSKTNQVIFDCEDLKESEQKPGVNCIRGLKDAARAPAVLASDQPAPKKLVVEDVVKGTGPAVEKGDVVSVHYVGSVWGQNKEFDSSFERGIPFETVIGKGEVIAGWDQGLIGMKEGGRRVLVIPPSLGYGAAGAPPSIPGNATLVFVIDLVSIEGSAMA